MAENRRARLAAQHGAVTQQDSAQRSTVTLDSYRVKWNHLVRLTAAQRDVVRFIRNSDKRNTMAAEIAALENRSLWSTRLRPLASRGAVWSQPRKSRVNTAAPMASVESGAAARVTQRDNRCPVELLKPLSNVVVGIATHPDATDDDYAQLLQLCRANPQLSTVRVITADNTAGTLVAVSDYQTVKRERETVKQDSAAQRDIRLQEMMGLANPVAATS
jgi:hypothetical protein